MAGSFQPKFVDLVRNYTTSVGTEDFILGPAVNGFVAFTTACQPGDEFYYSAIGIDNPAQTEVGRGTLLANGSISRDPIGGVKTDFTTGTKAIALIAAAEWYAAMDTAAAASAQAPTSAADRAALARLLQRAVPALLTEKGREGLFVWDGSDVSAEVSADAAQGVYVAPASDPTGASGAWVRHPGISLRYDIGWFGAKGDCLFDADTGEFVSGTDDYEAFAGAISLLSHFGRGRIWAPGRYKSSQTIGWSGAGIALEGASASIQPNNGSLIYFPNSGAQTGCINPKNGGSGLGAGSSVRNLTIIGANGVAVSAADAKLGVGSGLLVQAAGTYENVIALHCEGNGIYALSAPVASDVSINCNNATFLNCMGYACGNNGRATYGVDCNAINFLGGGAQQNSQFGDYINGSAGSTIEAGLYEGNAAGPLRFGDITGSNRVVGATYKEQGAALLVQFDAGGSGKNMVEFGTAQGSPGAPATFTITDNTANLDNDVTVLGVRRTIRMGGDGSVGTINVRADGNLWIRNGARASFQDAGASVNFDTYATSGIRVHYTDQDSEDRWYFVGTPTFAISSSGFGYKAGVGGAVTQATSKSTGVTLNKVCGQITMNGAALAAGAKVSFVVTNSKVAATDTVIANVSSGGTANAYRAAVTAVAAGSFTVTVENITGGSLSQAPVIGFAVIKAATA